MVKETDCIVEQDELYDGYPKYPPFEPHENEEMFWYHDPQLNVGCWIMNKYNKPMVVPKSYKDAVKYPGDPYKYKSPVPLHDMELPNVYRGRLVWYVDEEGFGKYYYYTRYRLDDGSQKGKLYSISVSKNIHK
jgi:hypothetical protein